MVKDEVDKKKKIMVAIDDSESSQYALEWTLNKFGDSIRNSELVIFTAQPLSDLSYLYASTHGAAPSELITNLQAHRKQTAQALLDQAKALCDRLWFVATTVTEVGDPKDAICDAVEKHNVELLVVGSHGLRKALERAFLGSVSNYCVHNAKCSVLVVRKIDM